MRCPSCGRPAVDGSCPACRTPAPGGGSTATLAAPARVASPAVRMRTPVAARSMPGGESAPAPPPPRDVAAAVAVVLGLLAVAVVPVILGPLALLAAAVANWRGERRAGVALAVAVAGALAGLVLGIVTAPGA